MVKNYGIHDTWTDLDKVNDVDIKAVDGVIDSIKVNGEEAGGGGDFTIAKLTIGGTERDIEKIEKNEIRIKIGSETTNTTYEYLI